MYVNKNHWGGNTNYEDYTVINHCGSGIDNKNIS